VNLALPAKLTIAEAGAALPALQAQSAAAAQDRGPLVVDAGALAAFDSSAIATLLALRREALAAGRGFSVHGAPRAMVDLAGLYGVAELLDLTARAGSGPVAA
jgi:phospholipid transport system transporter-binding protein